MTRQAVDRGLVLVMTVHAEPHGVLDAPLRNRLLTHVAVTRGTFNFAADVWRVIEPDVVVVGEAVHTLPGEVETLVPHGRDLLDSRPIRRDGFVADHAGAKAGNPGLGPLVDALMTNLAGDFFPDVNIVRKLERLLVHRSAVHEVVERGSEIRPCRCIDA